MRGTHRTLRRALGTGALALVVLAAAGAVFFSIYRSPASSTTTAQRTVSVTRGTVQATVSASGSIASVASADENFSTGGTLQSLEVHVGEQVHAGQVLATLDATPADASRASAQTALRVAQVNDAIAQRSVSSATTTYALARTSLATQLRTLAQARAQLATDETGGTAVQRDQSQQALIGARQQLVNDQNQLANAQTQLASDQQALSSANATATSDALLGCPAAAPGTSGGGGGGSVTASAGSAPSVATTGASAIATTTAQLNASINPNGAATTYFFAYGTTMSYGTSTASVTLPAGSVTTPVSATISGLSPDTTYLFTVEAYSAEGGSVGQPVTLTTAVDSCSAESATIASDQSKVLADQQQVDAAQSAIASQTLAVQVAQASTGVSASTLRADQAAITQDQSSIAQTRLGLVQDRSSIAQAGVQLAQDRNGIAQDEATLAQATTAVANTQLVALLAGTVTGVSGTVGQSVSGGGSTIVTGASAASSSAASASSALVTITGLHQLEVVADFAEADAIKLAVHQAATITLPASTSISIRGVVTQISPLATSSSGVVTYPVTLALLAPPASVRDGMTADVSVVVQTATNALEVPSAAITTIGTTSTVQVRSGGVTRTVTVTLGVEGGTDTQVTSGLSAGQTVVEPQATVVASTGSTSTGLSGGLGGGFARRLGGLGG